MDDADKSVESDKDIQLKNVLNIRQQIFEFNKKITSLKSRIAALEGTS